MCHQNQTFRTTKGCQHLVVEIGCAFFIISYQSDNVHGFESTFYSLAVFEYTAHIRSNILGNILEGWCFSEGFEISCRSLCFLDLMLQPGITVDKF